MLSLRAKILLFYILLQKYNNISKQARKSGKSFRKSYQEVLGEAGIIYWLASELKFKVTLLHVAQLLQLLSLMSLQPLYPFCQLGRRALYNYRFIYMYHKPIDEPTLKSKACLKCLYFTKIISDLCRNLEYFSYLYTIN